MVIINGRYYMTSSFNVLVRKWQKALGEFKTCQENVFCLFIFVAPNITTRAGISVG